MRDDGTLSLYLIDLPQYPVDRFPSRGSRHSYSLTSQRPLAEYISGKLVPGADKRPRSMLFSLIQQIIIEGAALPRISRDELRENKSLKKKLMHKHDIYRAIHSQSLEDISPFARCHRQPSLGARLDICAECQAARGLWASFVYRER